jgi:6-phosphogluconolactonase/glucosamine-6-phosphate isomerase/deaminase
MPRRQTFGNSAAQLTFFQDNDNSIPSWTTSALSAIYHHGHAMFLTFGQNKSAILIHALVQQSTT